jgi:hypothetical protein
VPQPGRWVIIETLFVSRNTTHQWASTILTDAGSIVGVPASTCRTHKILAIEERRKVYIITCLSLSGGHAHWVVNFARRQHCRRLQRVLIRVVKQVLAFKPAEEVEATIEVMIE